MERYVIVDPVVFSFSRGLRAGFEFNRYAVFCKPQDNRKINATFSAKSASLAEIRLLYTVFILDFFCKIEWLDF